VDIDADLSNAEKIISLLSTRITTTQEYLSIAYHNEIEILNRANVIEQ